MHIENFGLECRDCHFGIVHKPGTKTDRMNFCLTCHAENKDAAPQMNDCTACHEAQVAMNQGKGAKGLEGEPGIMFASGVKCTDCHTGVTKGIYRPSGTTCSDCHQGDAGYVQIFKDWQKETQDKLEHLSTARVEIEHTLKQADAIKRDTKASWELYEKALANLSFVKDDGTLGVHNNDFANAILKSVEADFKKIERDLAQKW